MQSITEDTSASPLALCKCLASQRQFRSQPLQAGQTYRPSTGPQSLIYLQLYWKESEDIHTTSTTAKPVPQPDAGHCSPTPQAAIKHQETVHMTLKHRPDKVKFLKGRFIRQVSLSAIHLKGKPQYNEKFNSRPQNFIQTPRPKS